MKKKNDDTKSIVLYKTNLEYMSKNSEGGFSVSGQS